VTVSPGTDVPVRDFESVLAIRARSIAQARRVDTGL
jgi:hypothetical protein